MNEHILRVGRPERDEARGTTALRVADLPLPVWLTKDRKLTTFCLDLPLPPSANDMWKIVTTWHRGVPTGGKLVRTDRYTAWWDEAGYGASWPQGYEGFQGIVLLYVDCGQVGRGRDVDNCIKPVQDLCAAMLGVNDKIFRFCAAFESDAHGVAPGRVGVTLVLVEG